MTKRVIALCDLNNAFVTMERLFSVELRGVPVVTASNNDSMIIARSSEAKALNIAMADPYFKWKHLEKSAGLIRKSANFPLYSNLSARFVATLEMFSNHVVQYSVDECFYLLNENEKDGLEAYGKLIRATLEKNIGMISSTGISETKTLSKCASSAAKKYPATGGVVSLYNNPDKRKRLLNITPVGTIWGVGKASTKKLNLMGIKTALELANFDPSDALDKYGVNLFRTIEELNGRASIEFEPDYSVSQSIIASRSLGQKTDDQNALISSIAAHISRASLKLRTQGTVAKTISVLIQTSLFAKNEPSYSKEESHTFAFATSDSRELLKAATALFKKIYKPGFNYAKTGIRLTRITPENDIQEDLFSSSAVDEKSDSLMSVIDSLNSQFGKGAVKLGSETTSTKWVPQSISRSPNYTGDWSELPVAKC